MSVEAAILARLETDDTVDALTDGRIWMLALPQHADLPAVRVQLIDEPRRYHLRGWSRVYRARVQVDAYAKPSADSDAYTDASALAEAIEAALSPVPFAIGSPPVEVLSVHRIDRRPMQEPTEIDAVRVMQDFYVWQREP